MYMGDLFIHVSFQRDRVDIYTCQNYCKELVGGYEWFYVN